MSRFLMDIPTTYTDDTVGVRMLQINPKSILITGKIAIGACAPMFSNTNEFRTSKHVT